MAADISGLGEALMLAEWNPRQLVTAINVRLSGEGRERLRLDPTAGYSWVSRGFLPRPPIPDVASAALTERLGFLVTPDQLWPGRVIPSSGRSQSVRATHSLGGLQRIGDFLTELNHLNDTATTPRSRLQGASGSDLAAAVSDQLRNAILITRTKAGREYVLPEQVDLISSHVAALRRLDDQHGGGALCLRYVTAELRSVIELVEYANYSRTVQKQLLTILADLAQLLGWPHFDSGRYGFSQRYLLLGVGICRALGSTSRAANTIGMLSYVSAFAGHGRQAVQIAQAATREGDPENAVLQARLRGRVATAAAADGDLYEFRKQSEAAAGLLHERQSSEVPSFLYYLAPEQLAAEAGQGLVVLAGRMETSRDRLLSESIVMLSDAVTRLATSGGGGASAFQRSALLHSTFLARAHLMRGDVSAAVPVIRYGLDLLTQVQSPRGRNCLRLLRPALAGRARSRAVCEILPDFDRILFGP
jgi:hypothetical protein